MARYEHTFLVRQDATQQQVSSLMDSYKSLIEQHGGRIDLAEYWGLKPTAYKINKSRRAHYAFFHIDAPHAAIMEMERLMGISSDVIRFLTVRVKEFGKQPSVMMRKQDERTGDRDRPPPRHGRRDDGRRDDKGLHRGGGREYENAEHI